MPIFIKNNDKPLFSRPFLAAILILVPLLIVILNLAAPRQDYPSIQLKEWQSDNQIPVTWISQEAWEGSNKLEIRLLFEYSSIEDEKLGLSSALSDLLLQDTLPLSRSSINQRLSPLAAKVDSQLDTDQVQLRITLNSESDYFNRSMAILQEWLEQPVFKPRTFANWQGHQPQQEWIRERLLWQLFPKTVLPAADPIQLEDIQTLYATLKGRLRSVVVSGYLPSEAQFKMALNQMLSPFGYQPSPILLTPATQISLQQQGEQTLQQTHAAIAWQPLNSVSSWLTWMFWSAELHQRLEASEQVAYHQIHLEQNPQHPWVWWSTQQSTPILQSDTVIDRPENRKEQLLTPLSQDQFDVLQASWQQAIQGHVSNPGWWADLAATLVTHEQENSDRLTLINFVSSYADAFNSFTLTQYQQLLQQHLLTSSYQEVQIHQ